MSNKNRKTPDPEVAEEIDRNLKRAFDEMAQEPLPDRFTNLLEQLRASGGRSDEASNDS
ncbi:NepR family anti-sigma factor [Cognatishimia maritima]|uniref:Anti-sigma factor NepR domain-containing protein n=1 Tax=Cognatishimia maritima TaxID=870908 RepID=A0A1M5PJX4_9RHOB|nr:NepR family anti-sigma factor [Cognatishimia maritima]SHH02045.1 hypothetical protein SAMN04488044_1846 [Cognatishimia maritima]